MDSFEIVYQKSLDQIETLIATEIGQVNGPFDIDTLSTEETISDLDGWDYCCAVMFGLAGLLIISKTKLAEYLADIHKSASEASGDYDWFQIMLGKLLHHKRDTMDQVDGSFINREGENAYGIFHRLFWGHDILSTGKDNPFYLMCKQKGGLRGVLQAVRHLVADTFSSQGLPVPGSSHLDFINPDTGKVTNHLREISKRLSMKADTKIQAERIYAHMFTIRAQDVAAGTVVKIFSNQYFTARGIIDEIRITQFLLIGYSVNLFCEAIYGCTQQGGIPYINLPLASIVARQFGKLYLLNQRETRKLQSATDELLRRTDELITSSRMENKTYPVYDSADQYVEELQRGQKNVEDLWDFLGNG